MDRTSLTASSWVLAVAFLGAALSGCGKDKKAPFFPCEVSLQERDIVFIVDQSETMYDNDPSAIRWEVLMHVAASVLNDERKLQSPPSGALTQVAFILFGGKKETPTYNPDLHWFTKDSLRALSLFLQEKRKESRIPKKQALYSDFGSALSLLGSKNLPWRRDATRYIFFISDGKYDLDNNSLLSEDEKDSFSGLLSLLRQRQRQWPIYFIGFGRPDYDQHDRPNVDVGLLDSLANAAFAKPWQRPTFSEPGLRNPNLVTIISSDPFAMRGQLHEQLELVLRRARFGKPTPQNDQLYTFPIIDPGLVEIQVEVSREIASGELADKLQIFVNTDRGPFASRPKLIDVAEPSLRKHLHAFVVDTASLHHRRPESRRPTSLRSWGLKSLDPAIALKRVSLVINDNWSVWSDQCDLVAVPTGRTTWRRLFHRREPPEFKLLLGVKAKHLCGGELPQARLRVRVQDRGEWIVAANFEKSESVYFWRLEIPHQEIFSMRIGWPVKISAIIDDLYACELEVAAETPVNGQPLLGRFTVNAAKRKESLIQ
jgi:hypothetical protein